MIIAGSCSRLASRIALAVAAVAIAACSTPPPLPEPGPIGVVAAPSGVANGAIYNANTSVALFENTTAHRVGDLLTVRLDERTQASKSAQTSTSKSSSTSIPGPIIAGRPVTVNGTEVLRTEISGDREFEGEGGSSQRNELKGEIAVTVIQRLPSGNLMIRGQKWLALNQGKELVQIEGIVRAIDIEPDNSVPSWKVADARITYSGRGALADANRAGWVARFFNSGWFPW